MHNVYYDWKNVLNSNHKIYIMSTGSLMCEYGCDSEDHLQHVGWSINWCRMVEADDHYTHVFLNMQNTAHIVWFGM